MPRRAAVLDEASRNLWESGEYEPSVPASLASSKSPGQRVTAHVPPQRWPPTPGVLLALGLALVAVGAGLVATPLALRATGSPPPPPAAAASPAAGGLNEEGVPLDALPAAQQDGEVPDCQVALADRAAYLGAAAAAEGSLLGASAADLPPGQLAGAVGGLPSLLLGTVFWVLVSDGHPWTPQFSEAAAVQVEAMNAAFEGLGLAFRLDAVVAAPASDVAVLGCAARWERLAAKLLPEAGPYSGGGAAAAADPRAVHVLVCEPEGARGAARVLGDGSGGGAAAGSVLLRRSALWQSRTSLVHQLGHFLGLPHPFPDEKETCRVDGDGVGDTPRTFAPNTGCPLGDAEDAMHVCPDSQDGPLPALNHMDLTNDTCRRVFSTGQAARMQAMLRAYRPRLAAAGAEAPRPQHPLALLAAWQSGPPARGSGAPAAQPSADPWQLAALAADGQLAANASACGCLGPDAAGRVFWAGQLNASYEVGAVRLLLPAWLGDGGPAPSGVTSGGAGSPGSVEDTAAGEEAGEGGGSAAAAAQSAAQLAAPEAAAAPAAAPAAQPGPALWLEVRVGDSLDGQSNELCVRVPLILGGPPLLEARCERRLAGRALRLELLSGGGGGGAELAARLAQRAACLCEVQPLAATAPALPVGPSVGGSSSSSGGSKPAVNTPLAAAAALNTSAMLARQSSGGSAPAEAALAAAAPLGSVPPCSATAAERRPWWSLDSGLDGAWVRGLRLSLPSACGQAPAGQPCRPPPPVSLSVFVSDVPPEQLLAAGRQPGGNASAQGVCADAVAVLGGRPVEVACAAGLMHGRHITVTVTEPQPGAAALSLCGVELLGAVELAPALHLAPPPALAATPPALQPLAAAAVDGAAATCLAAPVGQRGTGVGNGGASWSMQLDGSYPLVALRLDAEAAAAGGAVAVTLLDGGGAAVASLNVSAGGGGAAPPVQLPAGLHAAAVAVRGFSRLCEVQLLAAAARPADAYWLSPSAGGGSVAPWRVLPHGVEVAGGSLGDAVDADRATCLTARPLTAAAADGSSSDGGGGGGSLAGPAVEVRLAGALRLHTVRLLAGGGSPVNVTLAVAAPRAGGASPGWAPFCRPAAELQPWAPASLPCLDGPVLADRLLIRLAGADGGTAGGADHAAGTNPAPLTLCDVGLYGLPAPAA